MRRHGRTQEEQEALVPDPAQRPILGGSLHRSLPHSGRDHIMVILGGPSGRGQALVDIAIRIVF